MNEYYENLPEVVNDYIESVVKQMRYKKKVRAEVRVELCGHFSDALNGCDEESKEQVAGELIEGFGDAKMLAILIRRGKKRNRPLWKKAIIKTLQVIGIFILFVLLRGGYMAAGRATISVDYTQWLTEQVSGGKDESLNARDGIIAATELLSDEYKEAKDIKSNWPGDMSDEELELVLSYVQANEAAIDKFIDALEKPYLWTDYSVKSGLDDRVANNGLGYNLLSLDVVGGVMPGLSKYKQLARGVNGRVMLKAYNGDVDGAISECMVLQDFGSRQTGKGLLIEQLVGVSIEAVAHAMVYDLVDRAEVTTDQLESLQKQLEDRFAGGDSVISVNEEKALWYDVVQNSFTDDGKGSGRLLLKGVPTAMKDWNDGVKILFGIGVPDRREILERFENYFSNTTKMFGRTPWQVVNEPLDISWDDLGGDMFMLRILEPAYGRISELGWRLRADRDGLVATIAIKRFEKEKGRLPASLNDVVEAGYLQELPSDPYSDGHLLYKQTEEGFVFYGLGEDMVDDGGKIRRHENGRVRQHPKSDKGGDVIFWPRRSEAGEFIPPMPVRAVGSGCD